jgi:hypothetical protein
VGQAIFLQPRLCTIPIILAGGDIQRDLMKKTVMPYAMVVMSIGDHPIKKAIGISKLNNLEKMDLMLCMLGQGG